MFTKLFVSRSHFIRLASKYSLRRVAFRHPHFGFFLQRGTEFHTHKVQIYSVLKQSVSKILGQILEVCSSYQNMEEYSYRYTSANSFGGTAPTVS
jgi:hypothetical protein